MTKRWIISIVAAQFIVLAGSQGALAVSEPTTKVLKQRLEKSHEVVRFFDKRSWMLAPRYDKCWQVTGPSRRKVCRVARKAYWAHSARIVRINRILYPPFTIPSMWNTIAYCETGGTMDWHINTGNGYYGGLQFDISTWIEAQANLGIDRGEAGFVDRADHATPEQQVRAAMTLPLTRWPRCARQFR